MRRALLFVAASILMLLGEGAVSAQVAPVNCQNGQMLLTYDMSCRPVVDKTAEFATFGSDQPMKPEPARPGSVRPLDQSEEPQAEGNPAAGTTYCCRQAPNLLDGSEGVIFTGGMPIYPHNISEIAGTGGTIFTTETNRTEWSMEVYTRYDGSGLDLEVGDPTCDVGFEPPTSCPPRPDLDAGSLAARCYYKMVQTNDGNWNDMWYLNNMSVKIGPELDPDLWVNETQWFNWCTETWDVVYSHQFQSNQIDCSIEPPCKWWAGIVETAPREWPALIDIPALGFQDQAVLVFKPGEPMGFLTPDFTDWLPPAPEKSWVVNSLTPNYTYSVGTYFDGDSDGVHEESDRCDMNPLFPLIPAATVDDADCDGWPNTTSSGGKARETFLGTDISAGCAETWLVNDETGPDAWPLDFNDDQLATILDVSTFSDKFGSIAGVPPYEARWDLNGNGAITILDISVYSAYFGKRCTP